MQTFLHNISRWLHCRPFFIHPPPFTVRREFRDKCFRCLLVYEPGDFGTEVLDAGAIKSFEVAGDFIRALFGSRVDIMW